MAHTPKINPPKKAIKILKDSLIQDNIDLAVSMYEDNAITYREKQDMISTFSKEIKSCKEIGEICLVLDQCGYDDSQDIIITHLLSIVENLSKTHTNGK